MFLRWALASHLHLTFAVLGDNLHVITVLSPSSPPRPPVTLASRHVGILSSVHPGLPTPRDDPGFGVDKGARRGCGE